MFEGKDTFEITFKSFKEYYDYLKGKEDQTLWLRCKLAATKVHEFYVGDLIHPLQDVVKKWGLKKFSEDAIMSVGDTSNPELSHILLKTRTEEGKHYTVMLSANAYNDCAERYGARCSLFNKLSLGEQVDFLNKAPNVEPEKEVLIQYLDEKGWSVHGRAYKILPPSKLIRALNSEVETKGRVSFMDGYYSHNMVFCSWKIENDTLVEEYKTMAFNATGDLSFANYYGMIMFRTSDVGDYRASATPYITDGKRTINIGNPISMRHSGEKASVEEWKKEIKGIYAKFQTSIKELNDLLNVPIEYPATCAINLGRDLDISQEAISAYLCDMAGAYDEGGTALDVFMILQEAVYKMEVKSKTVFNSSLDAKKEELARLLAKGFHWGEYDVSEVFLKKKKKTRRAR